MSPAPDGVVAVELPADMARSLPSAAVVVVISATGQCSIYSPGKVDKPTALGLLRRLVDAFEDRITS